MTEPGGLRSILRALPVTVLACGANPTPSPQGVASMPPGVSLSLELDRGSYLPLQDIEAKLTIRHSGDEPVRLQFSTSQRYDLTILGADGDEIWRWSAERAFAQVMGEEVLGPSRRELVYRQRVSAPERPGAYTLAGRITTTAGPPLLDSRAITVAP